jgi:probable phosphoglycerate mutase
MGRVGLIRHGQTDLNLKGVMAGAMDVPLNSAGLRQAEALAKRLAGERVDLIYTSGLQRAYHTAEIIAAELGVEVIKREFLNELSQGEWEGLSLGEIKEKYPGQWEEWRNNPLTFSPPKGESVPQVYERVVNGMEKLLPDLEGKDTLIVGHQVANICIRCYLEGIDLSRVWELESPNATIIWLNVGSD